LINKYDFDFHWFVVAKKFVMGKKIQSKEVNKVEKVDKVEKVEKKKKTQPKEATVVDTFTKTVNQKKSQPKKTEKVEKEKQPEVPKKSISENLSTEPYLQGILLIYQGQPILESTIRNYLKEFGAIKQIHSFATNNQYCYVLYEKNLDKKLVSQFANAKIEDVPVKIRFLEEKDKLMYVGNVERTATVEQLMEYFSEVGKVEAVEIGEKNVAVKYKDFESVPKLSEYNGAG
jgi:hypothetical protein